MRRKCGNNQQTMRAVMIRSSIPIIHSCVKSPCRRCKLVKRWLMRAVLVLSISAAIKTRPKPPYTLPIPCSKIHLSIKTVFQEGFRIAMRGLRTSFGGWAAIWVVSSASRILLSIPKKVLSRYPVEALFLNLEKSSRLSRKVPLQPHYLMMLNHWLRSHLPIAWTQANKRTMTYNPIWESTGILMLKIVRTSIWWKD